MSAERSGKSHAMGWALTVLTVLMLYILSLGPVLYFSMGRQLSPEAKQMIEVFYKPVEWLDQTPLDKPLTAYYRWWGELGLRVRAFP